MRGGVGKIYTAIVTPNIALIKYWGKRDNKLVLPYNSSISITLGEEFNTKTSVMFTDKIKEDLFYINGVRQDLSDSDTKLRFAVVDRLREIANTKLRAIVASENSFPTAAGLASSASGVACLVFASAHALGLNLDLKAMSIIARQGSGSACRSLLDGFVKWERGTKDDGSDSYIRQIAGANHWPELLDIIAITSTKKKKIISSMGMEMTTKTSVLYKLRPEYAEAECIELEKAILSKDFEKLAMLTMRDSNNMHAVMLDTYPPLIYLNSTSIEIINAITDLNEREGRLIAAYTFDAGPNANIITLDKYESKVIDAIKDIPGIIDIKKAKLGNGPRLLDGKPVMDFDKILDGKNIE